MKRKEMAMLLSKKKRIEYFHYLGLGEYNKENIIKFQKIAFPNDKTEWDGKYGVRTDAALRHYYNVKKYCKNFEPEEFRCGCGGRYCTGYPTFMRAKELKHMQAIRDIYGPVHITSGLRCRTFNTQLSGSSQSSKHMTGKAADFYISGKTDTLIGRRTVINKIRELPNHNWSYCDGYNSNGGRPYAPNMGNAIHTEVK